VIERFAVSRTGDRTEFDIADTGDQTDFDVAHA
jgi:hypothetical protein